MNKLIKFIKKIFTRDNYIYGSLRFSLAGSPVLSPNKAKELNALILNRRDSEDTDYEAPSVKKSTKSNNRSSNKSTDSSKGNKNKSGQSPKKGQFSLEDSFNDSGRKRMIFLPRKRVDNVEKNDDVYLNASFSSADGSGIISNKLKFIGVSIFSAILLMILIGNYINSNNPLVPIVRSLDKEVSITVYDRNNSNIYSDVSTPSPKSVSPNLVNAIIALHGVLENRYLQKLQQKALVEKANKELEKNKTKESKVPTVAKKTASSDKDDSKLGSADVKSVDSTVLSEENSKTNGEDQQSSKEADNFNGKDSTSLDNNLGSGVEDVVSSAEEKVATFFSSDLCVVYTNSDEFGRYSCRYSYTNFLLNNFLAEQEEQSFVTKIINLSTTFRNYLLVSWIEGNINANKFLEIYFHYMYFGNRAMGVSAATEKYFGVSPDQLTLSQSIYLVLQIYNHNKGYYPNYVITANDILKQFALNGIINETDVSDLEEDFNNIKITEEQISFLLYLEDIFLEGSKYFAKTNKVNVNATFIAAIQNSSITLATQQMKKYAIPAASVVMIKETDIVSAFTMTLKDNKPYFKSEYPMVKGYNIVKPFVYMSLIENNKDVSTVLLDSKYQQLIFNIDRLNKFGSDPDIINNLIEKTKMTGSSSKNLAMLQNPQNIKIEMLTKSDLDVAPEEIRKLFAVRLRSLESSFLTSITIDQYKSTFKKYGLTLEADSLDELFSSERQMTFYELVRIYNALSQGGNFYKFRTITSINKDLFAPDTKKSGALNYTFANILKSIFFTQFESKTSKNKANMLIDYNVGVIFNDHYTVLVWFGDLDNPDAPLRDYTVPLEELITTLASSLQ